MQFEWNDAESARNLARYGVRFSEAVYVFLDPKAIEFLDERRGRLSLIGHTAQGLLYVVFTETAAGRVLILHARVADSVVVPIDPEFDFDARRIERMPRPDRHLATAADVSARNCRVKVTWELDAEVVAAFRERSVNEELRQVLGRQEAVTLVGDETLIQEVSRRVRRQLPA